MPSTDKRTRSTLFRDRLREAMRSSGSNQSALARAAGVDHSTVSQILSGAGTRMPNAQVVAECALALGVSADWLLGLTEMPQPQGEILDVQPILTDAARSPADAQIDSWHEEAAGYKIRHVPATLPDMLKTDEMLEWEYGPQLGRTTRQAIGAAGDWRHRLTRGDSDYEIAFSLAELESLARAEGYYRGVPLAVRIRQLERFHDLATRLYPSLRLYLYDARQVFSAPMSVYGPLLAVVYIGHHYVAFRETVRVRTLSQHFDRLVREAVVDARDVPGRLAALRDEVAGRMQTGHVPVSGD